ncbi:MAG: YkvA family protein [Myxococcota bacterium]
MKVSFELSPRDIRYFRGRLQQAREGAEDTDEKTIIRLAEEMTEEARAAEPPEFVLERLLVLDQLIAMLRDDEWRIEGRDRARILDALVYFVDPEDLIPDRVPGIGYLDDAIMVELVSQELTHDIKAYEDFCEYRETRRGDDDGSKLESRRQSLQARLRRRRRRERQEQRNRAGTRRSSLRLW